MSEFEVSKLVIDYNDGMGIINLSKKYNIPKTAIRKHLVNAGVSIRGRGRPKGSVTTKTTTAPIPEPTTEETPNSNAEVDFTPDTFRGFSD